MTKNVFVAGGTGQLGSRIVEELLRRGATVRALVRPNKADGGDALRHLVDDPQLTLVPGTLDDDVEALAAHLIGVDIVISAVQGGAKVVTDGQVNLIHAAEKAGVPRMIPSDFSCDLHHLNYGDNVALDLRKTADEVFAGSSVRPTSVLIGGFMEVMFEPFMEIVDLDGGTFSFWGDGEQPMDYTSIPDTAAYTAAIALDDTTADQKVCVVGEVLTLKQVHKVLQEVTGRTLRVRQLGSIADLETEIERRKATADGPQDFVALQYQWAMATGKAKLHDLENERYPDITTTAVREYLAATVT